MKPRVKICCISSVEEARLAISYGASALGLVSEMPSGPGPIPESLITEIVRSVPPGVSSFLLTCKQTPEEIIAQQKRTGATTLQLVDSFSIDGYNIVREQLHGIKIVQVIHVQGEHSIEEAVRIAPYVDGLLLDSGNPTLAIKELGGTGRVHDWSVSKTIRDSVAVPVFLAGGLHAGNVRRAFEQVEPYGIDVCSGVRTNGVLDEQKLSAFFNEIGRVL